VLNSDRVVCIVNFQEVYDSYLELKEIVLQKKNAIVKKDMDSLSRADETCLVVCEKISKFNIQENTDKFSKEEKEQLKKLGEEIKIIQENNEILIKHSLGVINNTLSGILHIITPEKNSYNAKGISCVSEENLDISSIVEEA